MSIVLCEECFPDSGNYEVLTIVPMSPCVECGRLDDRFGHRTGRPSLTAHLFRRDPRSPEGRPCTVNGEGDLAMNYDARRWFIGAPCVVVKLTKAGLVQVALADDPKRTISVPIRNIDGL